MFTRISFLNQQYTHQPTFCLTCQTEASTEFEWRRNWIP